MAKLNLIDEIAGNPEPFAEARRAGGEIRRAFEEALLQRATQEGDADDVYEAVAIRMWSRTDEESVAIARTLAGMQASRPYYAHSVASRMLFAQEYELAREHVRRGYDALGRVPAHRMGREAVELAVLDLSIASADPNTSAAEACDAQARLAAALSIGNPWGPVVEALTKIRKRGCLHWSARPILKRALADIAAHDDHPLAPILSQVVQLTSLCPEPPHADVETEPQGESR